MFQRHDRGRERLHEQSADDELWLGRLPRRWRLAPAEALRQLGSDVDVRRMVKDAVGRRAADGRDRQGAGRHGQGADPRRADRGDCGPGSRVAVRTVSGCFASAGVAIVYISHRLEEIFEIADRVTVLKDGRLVGTRDIGDDRSRAPGLDDGRARPSDYFPPRRGPSAGFADRS